jgi:hypothetical protein
MFGLVTAAAAILGFTVTPLGSRQIDVRPDVKVSRAFGMEDRALFERVNGVATGTKPCDAMRMKLAKIRT